MFGRQYSLSCWQCRNTHKFKNKEDAWAFDGAVGGRCPKCGSPLSHVPLPDYELPVPPRTPRMEECNMPRGHTPMKPTVAPMPRAPFPPDRIETIRNPRTMADDIEHGFTGFDFLVGYDFTNLPFDVAEGQRKRAASEPKDIPSRSRAVG